MQLVWVIVSNFVSNVCNKYIGSIIYNKSWIGSLRLMILINPVNIVLKYYSVL